MSFHRKRRSCVLVSSCVITIPLYLVIFFISSSNIMDFYQTEKFIAKVIDVESKDNQIKDIDRNDVLNDVNEAIHDNPYLVDYNEEYHEGSQEEDHLPTQFEATINDARLQIETETTDEPINLVDLSRGELLEDVEASNIKPHRDNSAKQIFFVLTNNPQGGFLDINPRQACAIESAANMHPNYNIYVLFTGPTAIDPDATCTKMVYDLLAIPNVFFRSLDIINFARDTPMEQFFETGRHKTSKHLPTHLADILRIVALYKYGGLYFDLDVVVVKSTEELGENYVVAANWRELMSGTMQFAGHGIGHKFAEACLEDLTKHFRGWEWAGNGPDLITRRMKILCDTKNVTLMTPERCQGMKVMNKKMFLPVAYTIHKIYFSRYYARRMIRVVENSYTAHIFNHMNHHIKLKKGQITAYTLLAQKYCPVVYDTLDRGDPF